MDGLPSRADERDPGAGAVASPHWAATEVGQQVLEDGGNAVDACVAMSAMLTVVSPHMCGIGGDLLLLCRTAEDGEVVCLNGTGPAPALATVRAFRELGLDRIPARGPLTVTVPGAVAAWEEALASFGSRPLAELLAAPIGAAERGVPVTARLGGWITEARSELAAEPALRRTFLDDEGRPLGDGATLRQTELALTLRRIAGSGAEELYRGDLGREVAHACEQAGGFLRSTDLEGFHPEWVAPVRTSYRELDVYTTPPNSQGMTTLMMLNVLTAIGAAGLPANSPAFIDALVAAKRAAFAARDRYLTDPDFAEIPVNRLLSAEYARSALAEPTPVSSNPPGGDTVYMCAVDQLGNACSLIQSIYYGFGSCFVAGDTGIVLHNRGHYFSLEDDHVNRLEPGKRPLHTLMACIALEDGSPRLVFGTMGADGQPQTNVQVLQQFLSGADAQSAVAAPRVLHGRFVLEDDDEVLHIEEDLGDAVIAELRHRGHALTVTPSRNELMGHANAIELGPDGPTSAGSDPRSDGAAAVLY
jgi:gamma-glutamyltranspeptidase/glutathione hydrolase